MNKIRGLDLWLQIDETTEAHDHHVVHVLLGCADSSFLVDVVCQDHSADHASTAQCVINMLNTYEIPFGNLKVLLTDNTYNSYNRIRPTTGRPTEKSCSLSCLV